MSPKHFVDATLVTPVKGLQKFLSATFSQALTRQSTYIITDTPNNLLFLYSFRKEIPGLRGAKWLTRSLTGGKWPSGDLNPGPSGSKAQSLSEASRSFSCVDKHADQGIFFFFIKK